MSQQHPLVSRLLAYQALCNRFEMEKAVTFFTEDAVVDIHGQICSGLQGMIDLHEYDRGCGALVYLSDFQIDGNKVRCSFVYEAEADRLLGISGLVRWSTLTFRGDRVERWDIEAPAPEEAERRSPTMRPLFAWGAEAHPELMARLQSGIHYDAGHALTELVRAWLASTAR